MIAKLHAEGLTHAEIARRLADKGYKSLRTGKPLDQFGVGYHVRHMTATPVELKLASPVIAPAAMPPKSALTPTKLQLALDVLKSELPDAVKKEVVMMMLNA
jgi:hypothetical protein